MPPDRCQERRSSTQTVLVLTDGSERARRTAEWWLVFAESSQTAVHRVDVLDWFDSAVVVERDDSGGPVERDRLERSPKNWSSDREAAPDRGRAPTTDVLHGVPHEVILDYVATNAVDRIVTSVCKRACRPRSFVGDTFARVGRTASVPVTALPGRRTARDGD